MKSRVTSVSSSISKMSIASSTISELLETKVETIQTSL
jgi:hypothetical protein